MSAEKELRGENGSFDTETSGFGGDVRERSARKRPKSGKWAENFGGSVVLRDVKRRNFGGSEIGVAELRSRRYMDRLKGNGEMESFKLPKTQQLLLQPILMMIFYYYY